MKNIFKLVTRFSMGMILMILAFSCTRIPSLIEEEVGSVIKIPFVRVLLEENHEQVTIKGEKSVAIECLTGGKQTVFFSAQPVTILKSGRYIKVVNHKGTLIENNLDEVNIIPRGLDNRLSLGEKRFRGIIKLLPNGETVRVINIIYMEDYLRGVVPPELGRRKESEIEAVKAQAVAARTYAMAHLKQYSGQPYDMKSSIIDQVYEGYNIEDKLTNQAIDATAGKVLFHNDVYVNAYYHSTCGGMTDDINAVWDRKELPYLKAVSDNDACSWSKYFRWQELFTEQQLRSRIEQYLSSDRGRDLRIGKIKNIELREKTTGGRVVKMLVTTDYDTYQFNKDRIRWVVGRTSNPDLILPSDRFDIKMEKDSQGYMRNVVFEGSGYGHGVGMCQCGAIGLSRQGVSYDSILIHYYTGTEIKNLY